MARFPFGPALETVKRSRNVEHFDRVANHDSVRPHLGGDGELKLAVVMDNLQNYAFETPHGGYILLDCGAGRYDVHSFFLPEGRGHEALVAMREVSAYMFTHTDCTEGRTTVPQGNEGAFVLAKRGGFELRFELERMMWRPAEGKTIRASFLALTLEKWALTSLAALDAGRWFHQQLDAAIAGALHPDEAVHDRMVGAAVLMTRNGQPEKAVAFYNAWALTAGYAPITIASRRFARPIVLDVVSALLEVTEDGMEILLCR